MSREFSLLDQSSLFSIGYSLNDHLRRVQAAECFYQLRAAVEKSKTRLEALAPRSLKRSGFRNNLERAIDDGTETVQAKLLLPLLKGDDSAAAFSRFILACLMLTEHHRNILEKNGLVDIFYQLFEEVAGAVLIPPPILTDIDTEVRETCAKTDSNSSKELLACAGQAIAQLRESAAKREIDPQEITDNEEIDPSEPLAVPRDVVLQFTTASVGRLEELLLRPDRVLLPGTKTSRQWRWERLRDQASSIRRQHQKTDCMIALVPRIPDQDFSFVLKVGYRLGWQIVNFLEYGDSIDLAAS